MSAYPFNPFAPSYFGGLNKPDTITTPQGTIVKPKPFEYIYNPPNNQLTANQGPFQDVVPIQADADFLLEAWYISLYTGSFQIQLIDSTGYQLMSGMINSGALSQSSADPTVFSPAHPFPASGKILLVIQDLSGATNPLQITFKGAKLFRVKAS